MQADTKYREELKQTSETHHTDDLTDLLNEAKHTILELQHEIESLKSEIEQLRQQNRFFVAQLESSQSQSNLKTGHDQLEIKSGGKESKSMPTAAAESPEKSGPVGMPLEPVIIVNGNKCDNIMDTNQKANEKTDAMCQTKKIVPSNPKIVAKKSCDHVASDQTTQSDHTYVA